MDEQKENMQLVMSRMADLEKHQDESENSCTFVIKSVTPGKVVAEQVILPPKPSEPDTYRPKAAQMEKIYNALI